MKLTILSFGQVAAITGNSFTVEETVQNTDALQQLLQQRFPALADIKYAVAVNKKMVRENISLTEDATVALLPPFSGG